MNELHCGICGRNSEDSRTCKNCAHLLNKGVNEETIRKMLADDTVNKIWEENKTIAEQLANTYYESVIENYGAVLKKDSKENFGYNTFTDGANMVLDIVMPLLNKDAQDRVKAKIQLMIKARERR